MRTLPRLPFASASAADASVGDADPGRKHTRKREKGSCSSSFAGKKSVAFHSPFLHTEKKIEIVFRHHVQEKVGINAFFANFSSLGLSE